MNEMRLLLLLERLELITPSERLELREMIMRMKLRVRTMDEGKGRGGRRSSSRDFGFIHLRIWLRTERPSNFRYKFLE